MTKTISISSIQKSRICLSLGFRLGNSNSCKAGLKVEYLKYDTVISEGRAVIWLKIFVCTFTNTMMS